MTKISTYGYKATITLKTGGGAGTVTFKVVGRRHGRPAPEDQQGLRDPLIARPVREALEGRRGRDRTRPHQTTPYRSPPGPSSRCGAVRDRATVEAPAAQMRAVSQPCSFVARPRRSSVLGRWLPCSALMLSAGLAPAGALAATPGDDAADAPPDRPLRGAPGPRRDRIAFTPGGRVSVPFRPRAGDPWLVDGARPRALPAGRCRAGPCAMPRTARRSRLRRGRVPTCRSSIRPRSSPPTAPAGPRLTARPRSSSPRPSIRAPSAARSSGSSRTGSSATARPRSTGRRSRPSPTSASAPTARAT